MAPLAASLAAAAASRRGAPVQQVPQAQAPAVVAQGRAVGAPGGAQATPADNSGIGSGALQSAVAGKTILGGGGLGGQ